MKLLKTKPMSGIGAMMLFFGMGMNLLLVLLLQGCNRRTAEKDDKGIILSIPEIVGDKKIPLSEIVSVEKYTPLETKNDAIIGELSKLITTDKYYIILDTISNSVFFYLRSSGSLVSCIRHIGAGLGEYDRILDIAYDRIREYVYILSSSKIIAFSSSGNFIREMPLHGLCVSYLEVAPGGFWALSPNFSRNLIDGKETMSNLLLMDSTLNLVQGYADFGSPIHTYNTKSNMNNNGEEFLFVNRYDDHIYQLDKEGLNVKYAIDYGNNNMEISNKIVDVIKSPDRSSMESLELENEYSYCAMQQWINLKDYFYFVYRKNMNFNYVLYSKKEDVVCQYSSDLSKSDNPMPFVNDFDDNPFYYFISGYGNDILLSFTSPENLIGSKKTNPILKEIEDQLIADDNFVIVEFRIKSKFHEN